MARNNSRRTSASPPDDAAAAAAQSAATEHEQEAGLSYVVPTEFARLPSRGRYYVEDHPLHNKEVVEIRHMTAKDEDVLTSRSLLKSGLAIDRLLQNLIVDKSIDPNSLLVGDKNAVLVEARIHAYTADYETRISCPACGVSQVNQFDLRDVQHNQGDDWGDLDITGPDEDGLFAIKLPRTKAEVRVRLLTGHDEKAVMKMIENRRANKLPEAPVTAHIKTFIASVNGHTNRSDVNNFVDNMPTLDSHHLRVCYNKLVPNVDMTLPLQCGECGTESRLEVPFTADFFWPNR